MTRSQNWFGIDLLQMPDVLVACLPCQFQARGLNGPAFARMCFEHTLFSAQCAFDFLACSFQPIAAST